MTDTKKTLRYKTDAERGREIKKQWREKTNKYRKTKREKGYILFTIYIPEEIRQEVKTVVKDMIQRYEKKE